MPNAILFTSFAALGLAAISHTMTGSAPLEPSAGHSAGPHVNGPALDEPFPAFRLPTVDGERVIDLRDFRGKKILLIDFASW